MENPAAQIEETHRINHERARRRRGFEANDVLKLICFAGIVSASTIQSLATYAQI